MKKTKTTDFILPLLGKPITFYFPYLQNAYIYNLENVNSSILKNNNIKDIIEPTIMVILRWNGHINYEKIVTFFTNNDLYTGEFEFKKGLYNVFLMNIPTKFKNDFYLILEGKYSKISFEAKQLISLGRPKTSVMIQVLTKADSLKKAWEKKLKCKIKPDQELWDKFKFVEETFIQNEFEKVIEPDYSGNRTFRDIIDKLKE